MTSKAHPSWSDSDISLLRASYPTAAWSEILTALPKRSRSAISQFARNTLKLKRVDDPRERWTADEIARLKGMWPRSDMEAIFTAFPKHGREGIQKKASALYLRRKTVAQRNPRFKIHPILILLRDEREAQRLTRVQVSKRTGYCIGQICNWENGKVSPKWNNIVDYADGLGLEIVLRKKLTGTTLVADVIPWPDKKRLMSGR